MRKTFKKSIAVILAVLMVVLSVPFTALAAPGEYQPNINLRFGAVSNLDYTGLLCGEGAYDDNPGKKTTSAADSMVISGLYGAPIDYDYDNGTLTLKASSANNLINNAYNLAEADGGEYEYGMDPVEGDYQYTVGDYFAVTVLMENIPSVKNVTVKLAYSDNIEPAGIYGYGTTSNRTQGFRGVSEYNSTVKATVFEPGTPYEGQCADALYPGRLNAIAGDMSEFHADENYFFATAQSGQNVDVTETSAPAGAPSYGFVGPDGMPGYTYKNTIVMETFMFKITGEGPVKFDIYDPENTIGDFQNASMQVYAADSSSRKALTTYSINTYENNGQENPGSAKMYYLGKNIKGETLSTGEEACKHENTTTVTTTTATCTEAGVETTKVICLNEDCGEVVSTTTKDVPALGHDWAETSAKVEASCTVDGKEAVETCSRCGATQGGDVITAPGHSMTVTVTEAKDATCTVDGNKVQMGCANCDYVAELETITAYGHHDYTVASNKDGATHKYTCEEGDYSYDADCTFGEWVIDKAATFDEVGSRSKTCTVCGQVVTEEIPVATCDHNGDTHTVLTKTDAATCTETGTEYYNVVCDICGEVFDTTTKTIDALGHGATKDVLTKTDAATCTVDGTEYYDVVCTVCNETIDTKTVAIPATGHGATKDVLTKTDDATCTENGTEYYDVVCTVCNETIDTKTVTIDAKGHTPVSADNAVASTCTVAGKEADTVCDVCGETLEVGAELPLAAHTPVSADNAVASTCTVAGKEADTVCDVCGETLEVGAALPLAAHTPVSADNAVAATCTVAGKEADTVCDVCGETLETGAVIAAKGHTPGAPETTKVDATFDAPGSITVVTKCTVCGEVLSTDVTEIPQLVGYTVTVDATGLGFVTLAGNDASDGASAKFEKGTKVTLTAEPVDGAKFVGWTANGTTLVSTDATFTTTVLANVTYTPVFEVADDAAFTVQFVDAYGNVVAIYTDVTADTVASIVAPAVPARPGYTATGWSVEDMATVTSSAVITPVYEKAETVLYTVNVPEGAVVTVNGAEVEAPYAFPFDTKVTVTLDGTEAWTVDGNAVAYGDSFTFFVTADVTLETAAGIAKTPSVAWVNSNVEDTVVGGKTKAVFKATRTMTDDCQFIDAGFVYAASALTADKLTLDNVDQKSIRASYTKTASEQFSLTVGIGTQKGTLSAVAFVAYVDAAGATQVVYTPVAQYSYR